VKFRPFAEAMGFVHTLKLKTQKQWFEYCKSGKKPDDIPANPAGVYRNNWTNWGNWLGKNIITYRPFEDAKAYVQNLKLKNYTEWTVYRKSRKRPIDIPSAPNNTYKNYWKGYGDWLGTGTIAPFKRKYRNFEQARNFVHTLRLKNRDEWDRYCKSGKKPDDIPANPAGVYKNYWKGIGDWLGTGYIATQSRKYRSFRKGREYVRSLNLENQNEWDRYCKSGKKPDDIPANPAGVYKNYWKGIGDWLGTGSIANQDRTFRPFKEAREYIHSFKFRGQQEWEEYCLSGKKPDDIPAAPDRTYSKEWKGMWDWLGYEEKEWSVRKVKELLRDLIESKIIYQWN
jgi:hypothetical protein